MSLKWVLEISADLLTAGHQLIEKLMELLMGGLLGEAFLVYCSYLKTL